MLFDVYRMFKLGQKLSVDEVKGSAPVTGQLRISTIRRSQSGPPLRMASLSGGEHNAGLLPSLTDCIVTKLTDSGEMLIIGTEVLIRKPVYKAQNDAYPQQWLCKPVDPKVVRRPPPMSARRAN
jgi:hypothetical protein